MRYKFCTQYTGDRFNIIIVHKVKYTFGERETEKDSENWRFQRPSEQNVQHKVKSFSISESRNYTKSIGAHNIEETKWYFA